MVGNACRHRRVVAVWICWLEYVARKQQQQQDLQQVGGLGLQTMGHAYVYVHALMHCDAMNMQCSTSTLDMPFLAGCLQLTQRNQLFVWRTHLRTWQALLQQKFMLWEVSWWQTGAVCASHSHAAADLNWGCCSECCWHVQGLACCLCHASKLLCRPSGKAAWQTIRV